MEFIRADVHGAADDPQIPVEVRTIRSVKVATRIDARRVRLEAEISCRWIHKRRRIGDIALIMRIRWQGAAVKEVIAPIVRAVRSSVVVDDGVDHVGRDADPAAVTACRVADNDAIVRPVAVKTTTWRFA